MSNNINHEIKTIVAELQSMSPRTQLEIVRLCKRVAELTPDYIEKVAEEITDEQYATFTAALNQAKTELQSQITTNVNDIDAEKTARESVVGVDAFGHTYLKTATANKQILIENDGFITIKSNDDNALMLHPNGLVQLITFDAVVECNANEGVKIKANASSENPYELVLKNNGEFEVSNGHNLKFNTNGELLLDGNPIGSGGGINIINFNGIIDDDINDGFYNNLLNLYNANNPTFIKNVVNFLPTTITGLIPVIVNNVFVTYEGVEHNAIIFNFIYDLDSFTIQVLDNDYVKQYIETLVIEE